MRKEKVCTIIFFLKTDFPNLPYFFKYSFEVIMHYFKWYTKSLRLLKEFKVHSILIISLNYLVIV